ncbi:hypothetical protein PTTG_30465 [Puccinia triticina 1-1 BBBD Race 1]|uniref:Uncharacterized protein n=2 Tax=Puccinia triticina TaxID=208348 RepID=A0A180FYZ8_PUCT1|nr:uncharacterized protein PtA15_3A319 [Puccinia triticina]OAV85518.1 hypothetical protein PTTG_30465 [Puccinia triticina 1-1 BBBD Race 1]WAQ82953.1 hypothetical protein PtA15_3A319 [Puccinia triticina]
MKLSILFYGPLMALILSTMVVAPRIPSCPNFEVCKQEKGVLLTPEQVTDELKLSMKGACGYVGHGGKCSFLDREFAYYGCPICKGLGGLNRVYRQNKKYKGQCHQGHKIFVDAEIDLQPKSVQAQIDVPPSFVNAQIDVPPPAYIDFFALESEKQASSNR